MHTNASCHIFVCYFVQELFSANISSCSPENRHMPLFAVAMVDTRKGKEVDSRQTVAKQEERQS